MSDEVLGNEGRSIAMKLLRITPKHGLLGGKLKETYEEYKRNIHNIAGGHGPKQLRKLVDQHLFRVKLKKKTNE